MEEGTTKKYFDPEEISVQWYELIWFVDCSCLSNIITNRFPKGLFLCREGSRWVAVDNTTSDAWTEDFSTSLKAIQWLMQVEEDY